MSWRNLRCRLRFFASKSGLAHTIWQINNERRTLLIHEQEARDKCLQFFPDQTELKDILHGLKLARIKTEGHIMADCRIYLIDLEQSVQKCFQFVNLSTWKQLINFDILITYATPPIYNHLNFIVIVAMIHGSK